LCGGLPLLSRDEAEEQGEGGAITGLPSRRKYSSPSYCCGGILWVGGGCVGVVGEGDGLLAWLLGVVGGQRVRWRVD
jgi:hypothetical protein